MIKVSFWFESDANITEDVQRALKAPESILH